MDVPAILVDDVAKHFGDVEALRGVSFRAPAGTVLGVLGPNGAGKTTAVRILTTLLLPDRGRAEVLGIDVVAQPARVRSVIGLAGQSAAIDENLTGRENLRLVGRLTHLSKARIADRSDALLAGFDLVDAADRLVRTYSGGMRRRLDLAAALTHEPPVLFLDEPTTGLDPRSRSDLWGVIEQLVEDGATVLLTTQYLEEADRLADNIIVVDHGSVIAEGSAAELKAKLGATVIEIKFAEPDIARRAGERIAFVGTVSVDGHVVHVSVEDGAKAMLETVRILDAEHLAPSAMTLREPTLDDVFLSLTGHGTGTDQARDGDADPTPDGRQARRRARPAR
jgi:ABC-2 type transport system ATP-binding protein